MKKLLYILPVLLIITFFGCKSDRTSHAGVQAESQEAAPDSKKSKEIAERKLLKEGEVAFETDDPNKTIKKIYEAVKKHEGYIASEEESNEGGKISTSLSIRVPSEQFDNLVSDISRGVERFDRKNIDVKDVTEEFIDVEARLKTKKEVELRYIELLKQAKNVTEILETEKQIGVLRGEIESMEGRLKYLSDRVAYSTLQVKFYKKIPNRTRFGKEFGESFRNGWDNLMAFLILLTNLWPFMLIILGVVFSVTIISRRNRKKRLLNSDKKDL